MAELVSRIRSEKGLSLKKVSDRSGGKVASSHVYRIENGEVKSPGVEVLRALARGLGVAPEILFEAEEGLAPASDPSRTRARFAELALKFDRVPESKRVNAEALVELLDRELERLGQ